MTSSFTYVRDWINKHPFKNEPNARLICSLVNGTPITSQTVWHVLKQLRLHIKRLVESGSIAGEQQREKLEHLLKTKKWNPYCFRHSAITDDSDHLPDYALKKKVRWSMNSHQGKRYIKQRMGDDRILEHSGIKIAVDKPVSVQRTCGHCGYVNKLESKYCERTRCAYPLTQLAFDEIKAAEQAKLQELVNKSNLERDSTIQALQQNLNSLQKDLQDFKEFELRIRNPDYRSRRRKEFNHEIVDEMKRTGKDLKTVLSERLDIDTIMSDIKNNKELPRIHRELITEELVAMKNNES
ncbi:MAG: hypothetical protein WBZ36_15815 [Candidatus Nitrosopolaris sp.]